MNYRIIRYSRVQNRGLMDSLINENQLYNKSFYYQLSSICNHSIMYGDSFSRSMNALGNEAFDFFSDFEIIQKQWAIENGVSFDRQFWKRDIIFGQISHYKPDVLYLQDTENLDQDSRIELKESFPFLKIIALYSGYPSRLNKLDDVDLLFSGTPKLVEQYKSNGCNAHLLYHGFDEHIIQKLKYYPKNEKSYNISFVGSSGYGYGLAHEARYWALRELKEKIGIHLFIEERDSFNRYNNSQRNKREIDLLTKIFQKCKGFILPQYSIEGAKVLHKTSGEPPISLKNIYKEQCNPAVYGLDMYRAIRDSKVAFNIHTDAAEGNVGNIRMFETTGIGTCLITDTGSNLADLFVDDKEVVTYKCIDECIEKVSYLLDNDSVRTNIADSGQKRTLKDHTIMNRCTQINEFIIDKLHGVIS